MENDEDETIRNQDFLNSQLYQKDAIDSMDNQYIDTIIENIKENLKEKYKNTEYSIYDINIIRINEKMIYYEVIKEDKSGNKSSDYRDEEYDLILVDDLLNPKIAEKYRNDPNFQTKEDISKFETKMEESKDRISIKNYEKDKILEQIAKNVGVDPKEIDASELNLDDEQKDKENEQEQANGKQTVEEQEKEKILSAEEKYSQKIIKDGNIHSGDTKITLNERIKDKLGNYESFVFQSGRNNLSPAIYGVTNDKDGKLVVRKIDTEVLPQHNVSEIDERGNIKGNRVDIGFKTKEGMEKDLVFSLKGEDVYVETAYYSEQGIARKVEMIPISYQQNDIKAKDIFDDRYIVNRKDREELANQLQENTNDNVNRKNIEDLGQIDIYKNKIEISEVPEDIKKYIDADTYNYLINRIEEKGSEREEAKKEAEKLIKKEKENGIDHTEIKKEDCEGLIKREEKEKEENSDKTFDREERAFYPKHPY